MVLGSGWGEEKVLGGLYGGFWRRGGGALASRATLQLFWKVNITVSKATPCSLATKFPLIILGGFLDLWEMTCKSVTTYADQFMGPQLMFARPDQRDARETTLSRNHYFTSEGEDYTM